MMKKEFERLTGEEVTWEQYRTIETVYMNYGGFDDKYEFIDYVWNAGGGYNGILTLYDKLQEYRNIGRRINWLRTFNSNIEDDIAAMERRISELRREQEDNARLADDLDKKAATFTFSIE